jgi:hypothetical protein
MVSLDFRTRSDGDIRPVPVAPFFDEELPALAASRSHLAVPGARELGVEPFTIDTPAGSWTLSLAGDAIRVERGDGGAGCVRLDEAEIADLVNDLHTPMTLLTAGTLDMERGNLGDFLDWWVVLRALVDGRPAHTAGAIDFRDRDGSPLDLHRAFTVDDDPADVAHFLAEAGFLHLAGVFTEEEMAQVSADMDAAFGDYSPDDGRSWWARTADGEQRPVRLQYFHEKSPTTAAILDDDRYLRIGRLTTDGYDARSKGDKGVRNWNSIEALVKPIGVVEGISDVPWHKDCSLGRHSYRCCSLTVGISVTGADARSGQLRVVAGSHRALVQPGFYRPQWGLPAIDLPTATGDVTVHCSCTMHMSQPPIDRERRVMYTGFALPEREGEPSRARIDDISRIRERAHKVVSQAPGHIPA